MFVIVYRMYSKVAWGNYATTQLSLQPPALSQEKLREKLRIAAPRGKPRQPKHLSDFL